MAFNEQLLRILLKEYDTCNTAADGINARVWQYTAILALGIAALGGFAVQSGRLLDGSGHLDLVVIGFAILLLSGIWPFIYRRSNWHRQIVLYRMRELEVRLGMSKNLYIHAYDTWKDLCAADSSASLEGKWVKAARKKDPNRITRLNQFFKSGRWWQRPGRRQHGWLFYVPAILGVAAGALIIATELTTWLSSSSP